MRAATIDVGTNSVVLLVAERAADGTWKPVVERAEITRLGRGVDRTKRLAVEAIEETVMALEKFAHEARSLGASAIVTSATSAARDSENGSDFVAAAKARAGLDLEIISGDEEARLCFAAVHNDFGGTRSLVVIDIGGGSTELIFGNTDGHVSFRHSFDVGSVRMTERLVKHDPPTPEELAAIDGALRESFSKLPAPPEGFKAIAVAGTATTVCAIAHRIAPYDGARVHGTNVTAAEISSLADHLAGMTLIQRTSVPGLEPKRADVIIAGVRILGAALSALKTSECTVSDRGLRWGMLVDRFGRKS